MTGFDYPNRLIHILFRSDELDEDELFTVCLDEDGHPVQRAVRDMTAGEVIAAIDHPCRVDTHRRSAKGWRGCGRSWRKSTPDRAEAERAARRPATGVAGR